MNSEKEKLQYYIACIIVISMNDFQIKFDVQDTLQLDLQRNNFTCKIRFKEYNKLKQIIELKEATISEQNKITTYFDEMIIIKNNREILDDLIKGEKNFCNFSFSHTDRKISIKESAITINEAILLNLEKNFSNLKTAMCYEMKDQLIKSISEGGDYKSDVNEVIRIAFNFTKKNYNISQILDAKKRSYQDIIFYLIQSFEGLRRLNACSQVSSIPPLTNNQNNENNIQSLNELLKAEIDSILKTYISNCKLKFLQDSIERIPKDNLKERKKSQKIIENFQKKLSAINYSNDYNDKVFEKTDTVSQAAQNAFNELIESINQLKSKYLNNLFNENQCFGEKKSEINYHSILNKYQNAAHEMYKLFEQYLDNEVKLESIQEKVNFVIEMDSNPIGKIILKSIDDVYTALLVE